MKNLFWYLQELPWSAGILSMVIIFILLAVLIIISVRKKTNARHLKVHHDVSGVVFANLGVLYAVLLGFTVVNVQDRFDNINQTAILEAGYLSELYRDAEAFDEKDTKQLQSALLAYANSIIEDEWSITSQGKAHPETNNNLSKVWKAYYNVTLSSPKQEILYAESIRKLNNSTSTRLSRIMQGKETLGDQMWTMLILGGILIVGFISVFSFENLWLHLLLASFMAGSIAFLLFLIYTLDTAFSGTVKVNPEAMQEVVLSFN